MTFPTAEDIEIMEADEYYWDGDSVIVGIKAKNKKEGNKIKQQILSEHEIVERLKVWLDDIPKGDARIIKAITANEACSKRQMEEMELEHQQVIARQEVRNELKSILENKPQ